MLGSNHSLDAFCVQSRKWALLQGTRGERMTVLQVIEGEREELRQKSQPIQCIDGAVVELARDLLETLRVYHVASLSAPQCGRYVRMFVTDILGKQQVWINPEITEFEGKSGSVESCASFPDLNLEVKRPEKLVVQVLELNGATTTQTLSGIEARLVAHEIDHLDGIIFHDRLDAEELFEQMLNSVETSSSDIDFEELQEFEESDDTWDIADVTDMNAGDEMSIDDSENEEVDEDIQQILDLLADGVWKITLAVELLKEFDLDEQELDQLACLERLGEDLSESVTYFESTFGDEA